MDYRKILPSREMRTRILTLLGWVPDSVMVRLQYWLKFSRALNLKNPRRFTEKLQLYKLKYRNADMLRCTDKYEFRRYIEELGYGNYLIPLIGVYDSPSDIDFCALPNEFVAKTTDGGGGNQILICRDKNKLAEDEFFFKLNGWMSSPKAKKHIGREWAYDNNYPRRIIIEQLIGDGAESDLYDYKFICFGGKVAYVYGISDRSFGKTVQLGVYDPDFKKLDVVRNDERAQDVALPKPQNFEQMKTLAEALAQGFPHVRVDLYNVRGRIYVGELTFYDASGYMSFTPDEFDNELGNRFDVSSFA